MLCDVLFEVESTRGVWRKIEVEEDVEEGRFVQQKKRH
jgi:hypothetical protein